MKILAGNDLERFLTILDKVEISFREMSLVPYPNPDEWAAMADGMGRAAAALQKTLARLRDTDVAADTGDAN